MPVVTKYPVGNAVATGAWDNGGTGLNDDDDVLAAFTTTTKNDVRTLTAGGFGLLDDVPEGSTINTISLEVEHRVSHQTGTLRALIVRAGQDGGVNDAADTTLTQRTFADQARPGGGTWERADLGDLEVRVEGRQPNNTNTRTFEWDYVRLVVDYTPPEVTGIQVALDSVETGDAAPTAPPHRISDKGNKDGALVSFTPTSPTSAPIGKWLFRLNGINPIAGGIVADYMGIVSGDGSRCGEEGAVPLALPSGTQVAEIVNYGETGGSEGDHELAIWARGDTEGWND